MIGTELKVRCRIEHTHEIDCVYLLGIHVYVLL